MPSLTSTPDVLSSRLVNFKHLGCWSLEIIVIERHRLITKPCEASNPNPSPNEGTMLPRPVTVHDSSLRLRPTPRPSRHRRLEGCGQWQIQLLAEMAGCNLPSHSPNGMDSGPRRRNTEEQTLYVAAFFGSLDNRSLN